METDPAAERIAKSFHEAYEMLAPHFGWDTQAQSRVRFEELPSANKRLMVATVRRLLDEGVIRVAASRRPGW